LCGGRVVLGVGAGYRQAEFDAVGIPFEERFARLEEGVQVMRQLWSGDDVTSSGLFGSLNNARLNLRPVQTGGPPIYIGASSNRGLRRVAELDASWLALAGSGDASLLWSLRTLRTELANHNRPLARPYPLIGEIFIAETEAAAVGTALRFARMPKSHSFAAQLDNNKDFLTQNLLTGTPDTVIKRIREWNDKLGITDVILRFDWVGAPVEDILRAIVLVGKYVIPEVRTWGSSDLRPA
jgi:alkanesulfonate monooxygenase SsuD/methylene tetrahydromethanopterin reductase-like flavin-dependent oxidoreductase (luciferase family)